jgi:hypothetical protein
MNFKKIIYLLFITASLISISVNAMQSETVKSEGVKPPINTNDELWIDRLRKYDPIAANIIIHLANLNPSLKFVLQCKQSEVEQYFKDHPEILQNLLKISQHQLHQQNTISNSQEKAKLSLDN